MTRVRGDPRRQSTYQKSNKRTHSETQEEISQSINPKSLPTTSAQTDTILSSTTVKSNRKSKKPKLSLDEDDVIESPFTDTIDAPKPTIKQSKQAKQSVTQISTATEAVIAKPTKRRQAPETAKPIKSALKVTPAPIIPPPEPIKPIIVPVPALPELQPAAPITFPPDARRADLIEAISEFYKHELAAQLSVCETVYGVAAESQPHAYLTAFTEQVCDAFLEQLPGTLDTIPLTVHAPLPQCKHEQSNAVEFWRDAVAQAEEKLSEFQAAQHSLNQTFTDANPAEPIIETDVNIINPNSLEERSEEGYSVLSYQTQHILDQLNYMNNQLNEARQWRIQTAKQARDNVFGRSDMTQTRPAVIKELVKQMAQPTSPLPSKR